MKLAASLIASALSGLSVWYWIGVQQPLAPYLSSAIMLCFTFPTIGKKKVVCKLAGLEWTEDELCENFFISGKLGSGKTTAVFNIMDQLFVSSPGWGGIFMDAKGEDHLGLLRLAEKHGRLEDVVILEVPFEGRTAYPRQRMNLLTAHPPSVTAKILAEISYKGGSGGDKNSDFFRHQTVNNLIEGMHFLEYRKYPITTVRLRGFLCSQLVMMNELEPMLPEEPKDGNPPPPVDPKDYAVAIKWVENYIRQPGDQKGGVIGSIANALTPLVTPDVAEVFANEQPDTVSLRDIDNGKILCILCPSSLPNEKAALNQFFKSLFFYTAARRFDLKKFGEDPKDKNLLLAFLDEYQNSVSVFDREFLSVLRSARCAFLAAMQDAASLDPVVGADNAKVILGKFQSRIIFKPENNESAENSSKILGKKEIWKRSYSSGGNGGSSSRSKDEEPVIKPQKFKKLSNHRCVIIHTNGKFRKNVKLEKV